MKKFIKTILALYSWKLITVFLLLFFIIRIPALQIVPDYLHLSELETPQSYIIKLLSIVIGFSSFILTILLLIYNTFSKKIRRNSFDFVLDNPWVKIAFSLFSSSLIFIFLVLITLKASNINTITTLIYISTIIAFSNLLIQFPILILSIKHSNSYEVIKKLIDKIDNLDLETLYKPNDIDEHNYIEVLEKNKLIQLKDIGLIGIKENDWGLPQTILNDLFEKLISPLNNKTEGKHIEYNVYAFDFISRHFKKIAIQESDEITTNVLLNNLLRTHIHFAKNEIRDIRNNPIDESIIDLNRLIIENKDFYNIQPYLLSNLIKIIDVHIKSFNFTDDQIPTFDYKMENREKEFDSDFTYEKQYWYYIKDVLPDLYLKTLENAIENKNKNVYSSYLDHSLHSFIDTITKSKTLSKHQQYEMFKEYSNRAIRITNLAIKNGIYSGIVFYSEYQVIDWIENDEKFGFNALYDLSYLLNNLNKQNILYYNTINDFFMIARVLSSKKIKQEIKVKAIKYIIETGFDILEKDNSQQFVKEELKRQLKWLNKDYINREIHLKELKTEFSNRIKNI